MGFERDPYLLYTVGGPKGLEQKLDTNLSSGLPYNHNNSGEDSASIQPVSDPNSHHPSFKARQDYYGINRLPEKKPKSFLQLVWIALQDKVLILLSVVAVISLAIGLYQTFGQPPEYDENGNEKPHVEWVEGVAIIVAIAIVSLVGAGNDWQKERQFVKLNKKKEDRSVRVIRGGHTIEISIFDIVVGDIVQLEPGDIVPCDGLLVHGYGIKADESSITGESDTIKKKIAADVYDLLCDQKKRLDSGEILTQLDPHDKKLNCFIISGSKILEGTGEFLVTGVGQNSTYGKTILSLQTDPEETPLQVKLNIIAEGIAKLGTLAAFIMFVVLFIRFLAQLPGSTKTGSQKGEEFLNILITAITIIVVAVPEGLPLAVTLALAFATTRMIKDNNLVRVLKACETMGGATAVCSDKTGTLTQNKMTVVTGTAGISSKFELVTDASSHDDEDVMFAPKKQKQHEHHKNFLHLPKFMQSENHDANNDQTMAAEPTTTTAVVKASDAPTPEEFISSLEPSVKENLLASIVANTSAFENLNYEDEIKDNQSSERYVGSKTETALLSFAYNFMDMGNLEQCRQRYSIARVYPFDSAKKYMATVIKIPGSESGFRLLVKGASEVMVSACNRKVDPSTGKAEIMSSEDITFLNDRIVQYASQSLRAIGMIYKDFPDDTEWPPQTFDESKILSNDFTFLGIVGIKDPLRHGVRKAVYDCKRAGVTVRMVTGDNVVTATAISKDCGILENEDQLVLEGPVFRKKTKSELYGIVPKLRVLARSSPDDKRLLVEVLKDMGETVAVTGDGTNDAPALKLADVGFSMGISGTEVAKEASEIILMDDNFGSIVKAIVWGRTVNDAVKKFLQFQLTVNITAVILTFVSAVASSSNESVLTAVQLLWVNLIMDTFAALALATDPPTLSVLERKPDDRKALLITPIMWKIIIGEAIYQLIVSFVLNFAGNDIFDAKTGKEIVQVHSLVFNTFVWMQYFKMFVARRLDNKLNMFEGIFKNWYYIVISTIICGAQVLIMFFGGAAFNIVRQTPAQWGVAILCGFGSIPVGILLRCIPDAFLAKIFPSSLFRFIGRVYEKCKFWKWFKKTSDEDDEYTSSGSPKIRVFDEESRVGQPQYVWPEPLEQVRQDLIILKLRGGRWNQIKQKPKQIMQQVRKSFSTSGSTTSVNNLSSSATTLNSPFSPPSPVDGHSLQLPNDNTHASNTNPNIDDSGFLSVPNNGGSNNNSSSRNPFARSRGNSTSSKHSIDALAMVPTIVGGAIAGWGSPVPSSSSTTNLVDHNGN